MGAPGGRAWACTRGGGRKSAGSCWEWLLTAAGWLWMSMSRTACLLRLLSHHRERSPSSAILSWVALLPTSGLPLQTATACRQFEQQTNGFNCPHPGKNKDAPTQGCTYLRLCICSPATRPQLPTPPLQRATKISGCQHAGTSPSAQLSCSSVEARTREAQSINKQQHAPCLDILQPIRPARHPTV